MEIFVEIFVNLTDTVMTAFRTETPFSFFVFGVSAKIERCRLVQTCKTINDAINRPALNVFRSTQSACARGFRASADAVARRALHQAVLPGLGGAASSVFGFKEMRLLARAADKGAPVARAQHPRRRRLSARHDEPMGGGVRHGQPPKAEQNLPS